MDFIHRAIYMLSVIRHFLLRNARELNLEYEGIRVVRRDGTLNLAPRNRVGSRLTRNRGVILECDDEYIPASNEIRSRLQPLRDELVTLSTRNYMATEEPPPVVQPRGVRGARQRVRPQEAPTPQIEGAGAENEDQMRQQRRQRRNLASPPPGEEGGGAA